MANLYELDQRLQFITNELVDIETGEIIQDEQTYYQLIDECVMELDKKIENISCYIKNLKSDVEAFKQEEQNIAKRRKAMENKVDGLTNYLSNFLQAKEIPKFETPKCKLSFRKSTSVDITNIDKIPKEYITEKVEYKADKKAIGDLLKKGQIVEGAELVTKQNISIK